MRWRVALAALALSLPGTLPASGENQTPSFQGQMPASGNAPDSLVVFLHGYGSTGLDFAPAANALQGDLPNTLFYYPNAPLPQGPGYSWYDFENPSEDRSEAAARDQLAVLVEQLMAEHEIPPSRVALVGFSQGAGMAVGVATCASPDLGLAVSMGGVVRHICDAEPDAATTELLFLHNNMDPVVGVSRAINSVADAKAKGYAPELEIYPSGQHWLTDEGLRAMLSAVRDTLAQGE